MAAVVGKLASSDIVQNVAENVVSSSLGQNINPDIIESAPAPTQPVPAQLIMNKKIEEGIEKVVELKDKFDNKLDNYYFTLKIVLVLVVVTIISIIIYRYKLPLICYGCESPEGFSKYIFKCVNDTSKDSDLCKISSAIDNGTQGIYNEIDKITIVSRSVFQQLTTHIPDTIKKSLKYIIDKISALVEILIKEITDLMPKFKQFLNDAFSSIKDVYVKSRDFLYTTILKPIVDFISSTIITPISQIITELLAFKDLVFNAISTAVSKVGGVFIDLRNGIINPLKQMPKSLEGFINQIIGFLNDFAKGGAKITKKALDEIVGGIEMAINKVIGFLNDFAKGGAQITRNSINTVVDKIGDAVNGTIGGINTATGGISSGLTTAINPIVGAINEVARGINKAIDVEVPEVAIPRIAFPSLDLGVTRTPEAQIIPRTKIFGPLKPLASIPKAREINFGGLNIPRINNVNIPKPEIRDPTLIQNLSIPRANIPDPKVIPPISLDQISNDISNGLSFAYNKATEGIRGVYSQAMAPIDQAITVLVGLATTLSASIRIFFDRYLNKEFLIKAIIDIKNKVSSTVGDIIEIIKTKVFNPFYEMFLKIKDKIVDFITDQIKYLKGIFNDIIIKVNKLFETLSDSLWGAGTFIIKNIFYVGFYTFTNFVDKIIPLQVQKTVKVNFVLITVLYLVFLYFSTVVRSFVKELLAQSYVIILLLSSFFALYFLFPKKEEVLKMTPDAKPVINTTVLPANMDKKEKYENIDSKNIMPYEHYQNQYVKVNF